MRWKNGRMKGSHRLRSKGRLIALCGMGERPGMRKGGSWGTRTKSGIATLGPPLQWSSGPNIERKSGFARRSLPTVMQHPEKVANRFKKT